MIRLHILRYPCVDQVSRIDLSLLCFQLVFGLYKIVFAFYQPVCVPELHVEAVKLAFILRVEGIARSDLSRRQLCILVGIHRLVQSDGELR